MSALVSSSFRMEVATSPNSTRFFFIAATVWVTRLVFTPTNHGPWTALFLPGAAASIALPS